MLFKILLIFLSIKIISSLEIDCTFQFWPWSGLGEIYTCDIIISNPSINDQIVTNITGTHQIDKSNNDVEAIYIRSSQTLKFVPRGFINFFNNTIVYMIDNSAIETLYGDEIKEFGGKLKHFGVRWSNLTTISSQLFGTTTNLSHVWFDYNKITKVGKNLFKSLNLTELKDVRFYSNHCIRRNAHNKFEIQRLINDLEEFCVFDDEEKCFNGKTEDFFCQINENYEEIQDNLLEIKNDGKELKNNFEMIKKDFENLNDKFDKLEKNLRAILNEQKILLNLNFKKFLEMLTKIVKNQEN